MCQGSVNNDQKMQAISQARETVKLAERGVTQILDTASRTADDATLPALKRTAELLAAAGEELHAALHAAQPEPSDSVVVERV